MQHSHQLQQHIDRHEIAKCFKRPVGIDAALKLRPLTQVTKLSSHEAAYGFMMHNLSLNPMSAAALNLGDINPNEQTWFLYNTQVM